MTEARTLFWPWCLMTVGGLLPLVKTCQQEKGSSWPDDLAVFAFFGGAAILAAAPFRRSVRDSGASWYEKMILLSMAAIAAASIVCLAQLAAGIIVWEDLKPHHVVEPLLLFTILICSTGFWTLLTRSIVGGIVFTGAAQFILYLLLVLFVTTLDRLNPVPTGANRFSHQPTVHSALMFLIAGIGLTYAATMLWLSRRKFAAITSK